MKKAEMSKADRQKLACALKAVLIKQRLDADYVLLETLLDIIDNYRRGPRGPRKEVDDTETIRRLWAVVPQSGSTVARYNAMRKKLRDAGIEYPTDHFGDWLKVRLREPK